MEEIKAPKKERKFLKAMGDVALTLFRELLLGVGKKVINKVGNKRQGLAIAFVMVAGVSYAAIDSIPYPITGNKQKLGWQTSGNGLVYRGTAADTITKPSNYTNKDIKAYLLVDTVNNVMYSYIASKGGWKFNNTDTVIINNNFAQPVDSLFFKTSVVTNNVDTAKMRWDNELATVVLGMYDQVPNELGFKNFWLVKNQTGSTITKNSIVYTNGTVGASGRITVAKFIANGSIESKYVLGITAHDLTNGEDGYVISYGKIRQVNTDTFAAGAILYPSPTTAGVWTDVEPVAPNIDMPIGLCVNSSLNNGTIAIKVESGYKLHELHDVAITSPVDKASLYYKSSEGLWRDTTATLLVSDTASMLTNYAKIGTGGTVTSVGGTGTVNGITLTGTVTSSGNLTLGGTLSGVSLSSQVSGTLPIANGGTGATTAATARTALGATVRGANTFLLTDIGAISFLRYNADNTVSQRAADGMRSDLGGTTIGQSMFTLTNPSAVTFPRFNADNTVSALDAATFRTAIGAGTGTGTVTSVTGTAPISVATGTTTPAITVANAGVSTTGVVTATTQTFGGTKTFNGVLNASSDLNVTGLSTLTGGAVIGTMATTSSLTHVLGVNSSNAIGEIGVADGIKFTGGFLGLDSYKTIALMDFPNTSAQSSSDITSTVTGAVAGTPVLLGVPNAAVLSNTSYSAWVSSTNTVTVRFNNYSSSAANPAQGSFYLIVLNL
tara:strand:- start:458 stop:2626 length:2169 start_codon:yes stop_codon:yes gene_type:complete